MHWKKSEHRIITIQVSWEFFVGGVCDFLFCLFLNFYIQAIKLSTGFSHFHLVSYVLAIWITDLKEDALEA